ncbi:hypothetical protein [Paracoccus sp. (in: a-proteobacteria)]|uniref:hypothetical protein n=1 Tax=Paracoccus sp. TaxID=267 RepID=UPI003A877314
MKGTDGCMKEHNGKNCNRPESVNLWSVFHNNLGKFAKKIICAAKAESLWRFMTIDAVLTITNMMSTLHAYVCTGKNVAYPLCR